MIRFHFELFPINKQVKPYEIPFGHVFQGVIFGWLHEISPELFHELHAYGKVRPYAINCHIHRSEPLVEFSIVSFNSYLSAVLLKIVHSVEGKEFDVAEKKYMIEKCKVEKISYETIFNCMAPIYHFYIDFITPVHFQTSRGAYPIRFPLPEVIFGNLSTIWNNLTEISVKIDRKNFLKWINAHCYASGYRMKSSEYYISSTQKVAGGIGFVSYQVKKPNKNFYEHYEPYRKEDIAIDSIKNEINNHYRSNCCWIDLLCRFGEYINVGRNRTAGMGVIRYHPKNYLEEEAKSKLLSSIT